MKFTPIDGQVNVNISCELFNSSANATANIDRVGFYNRFRKGVNVLVLKYMFLVFCGVVRKGRSGFPSRGGEG